VNRVLKCAPAIWDRFNNLSKKQKLDFIFLSGIILNKIREEDKNINISKKDLVIEKTDIWRDIKWDCILVKLFNQKIILPLETKNEILERTNRKDNDTIGERMNKLNWIFPPFQQLKDISKIIKDNSKNDKVIKEIYSKLYISKMVTSKYPKLKYLREYNQIIKESVEAFYFGLTKIAIISLLPVIDGVLNKMIKDMNEDTGGKDGKINLFDLPRKIIEKALKYWREKALFQGAWISEKYKEKQFLRKIDETSDLIITFQKYCEDYLLKNIENLDEKTYLNRHLILHLVSRDKEINYKKEITKKINFYILISLIDCLAFINCLFENGEASSFLLLKLLENQMIIIFI